MGGSGAPDPVVEAIDLVRSIGIATDRIETAMSLVGSQLRIVEARPG